MARETVSIEGLDDVLRRLRALGAEASKRGGPVRAGVRAGAMVIVREAKLNVQRIIAQPNVTESDPSTGLLEKSIAPFRSKARGGEKGETFVVTVKRSAKYSDERVRGKLKTARVIGQRLEYGTGRTPEPKPWLRPAFHSKKNEAVNVMKEKTLAGIEKLEKKLSRT